MKAAEIHPANLSSQNHSLQPKPPCSLGKVVQKVWNIVKLVFFLGALLGVQASSIVPVSRESIPPSNPSSFCVPSALLRPYMGDTRVGPSLKQSFTYQPRTGRPAVFELDYGGGYVYTEPKNLREHNLNAEVVAKLKMKVIQSGQNSSPQIVADSKNGSVAQVCDYKLQGDRGFIGGVQDLVTGQITEVNLVPSMISNYQKAIEHVDGWVPKIGGLSEEAICEHICETHRILGDGLPESANVGIGTYRKDAAFVGHQEKGLLEYVQEKGTSEEASIAEGIIRKQIQAIQNIRLTKQEKRVFRLWNHPQINPRDPFFILKFVNDFQNLSQDFLKSVKKHKKSTFDDVMIADNFLDKIIRTWSIENIALTQREKEVIRLWGYMAPHSRQMPRLMLKFARNLKKIWTQLKVCPHFDPFAGVAWVMRTMGDIHPFRNYVGRTTRQIVNGLLKFFGHRPLVFPNFQDYVSAIQRDQKTPGFLATYLREVASWTEKWFGQAAKKCLKGLSCAFQEHPR